MSEMEDLKIARASAYLAMKASHKQLVRAHKLCESIERRYIRDREEYEGADSTLALLDGRFQRLLESDKGKKKKAYSDPRPIINPSDFTPEQIMKIAQDLGIQLPAVEEEVDPLDIFGDEEE